MWCLRAVRSLEVLDACATDEVLAPAFVGEASNSSALCFAASCGPAFWPRYFCLSICSSTASLSTGVGFIPDELERIIGGMLHLFVSGADYSVFLLPVPASIVTAL